MVLRKPDKWSARLEAMKQEADSVPFSPKIKEVARRAAEKVRESMENLPVGEDEFVLREDEGTSAQVEDDTTLEIPLAPLANELSEADTDFIFNITEALKSEASDIVGNTEGVREGSLAFDTADEEADSPIENMKGVRLGDDMEVFLSYHAQEFSKELLGDDMGLRMKKSYIFTLAELRKRLGELEKSNRKGNFMNSVQCRFHNTEDNTYYRFGDRVFLNSTGQLETLADFLQAR